MLLKPKHDPTTRALLQDAKEMMKVAANELSLGVGSVPSAESATNAAATAFDLQAHSHNAICLWQHCSFANAAGNALAAVWAHAACVGRIDQAAKTA